MSGRTRIPGGDFPEDLTRSIVFFASRCDRSWCEIGAMIAACQIVMVMRSGAKESGRKSSLAGRFGDGPGAARGLPGTMVAGVGFEPTTFRL